MLGHYLEKNEDSERKTESIFVDSNKNAVNLKTDKQNKPINDNYKKKIQLIEYTVKIHI